MKPMLPTSRRLYLQFFFLITTLFTGTLPAFANGPAPDSGVASYETAFLKNMIGHHTMAVDMGNLCLQKAVHQDLRTMCSTVIAAQKMEIQDMRAWLATWYGVQNFQPMMTEEQMRQMRQLSMLNNSDFEIAFMKQLMMHHKVAIVSGAQCMQWAYHGKLIGTCENIVLSQTREVQALEDWLRQWYAIYIGRFSKN